MKISKNSDQYGVTLFAKPHEPVEIERSVETQEISVNNGQGSSFNEEKCF